LVNDIEARKNKISLLDKTVFSLNKSAGKQNKEYKNLIKGRE
jgi:hypothetical protein